MCRRIQMTRQKPWRHMHPDAVIVARPSPFGNPFRVGSSDIPDAFEATRRFEAAVAGFWSNGVFCPPTAHPYSYIGRLIARIPELRGHDLACWCPLDQPCHADVLLRLANG